jgi:hypothetical protein
MVYSIDACARACLFSIQVDQKREAWGMAAVTESPYATADPPLTIMAYSPALCPPPSDWDPEKVRHARMTERGIVRAPLRNIS